MIYNSRKYPTSLFIQKSSIFIPQKGCIVLYMKNKIKYMGKVSGYCLKGMAVINTNWIFAETLECVSIDEITHISKNSIE